MIKTAAICILLAVYSLSFAQDVTKLDSLYSIWENNTMPDSLRVRAFGDYLWDKYMFSEPDSAFVFSEELYKFAQIKNYKIGMSNALNYKGVSRMIISDYAEAIKYFNEALEISKEINNEKSLASIYGNLANIYNYQGQVPKAISYFKKCLGLFQAQNNDFGVASTLTNLGVIYYNLNDYERALEYDENALEIFLKFEDKRALAGAYHNIGTVYNAIGKYSEAIVNYEKSIEINTEIKSERAIATSLSNIGDTYSQQKQRQKALPYFYQSLEIREAIGDRQGESMSLNNIGIVNGELGNHRKAIQFCEKSQILSEEIGALAENKVACKCLYDNYKKIGNKSKALDYHEKMLILTDSLQLEETAKKLQKMEFEKEVLADSLLQVERELKVEMVHQAEVNRKNRTKNAAIAGGIFFLLLSGGLYSRWNYVKKSKAIVEKEKDRSENLLLNILPSEIAEELKAKGSADARDFDLVSILFTDFKGFTQASEKLTAKELIDEINTCFKAFDHICEKYGVEKIKTIGDAYMAAGGLPVPSDMSVKNTLLAALEMQHFIISRLAEKEAINQVAFQMRVGVHTGPVVAGIVGVKKFQYDIWGDTVNTASRMESSGAVGKVNVSETTYNLIKDDPDFTFESRGKINAKGKGDIEMYFVSLKSSSLRT